MTYLPPHFRVADENDLLEFMRAHEFVTLISPGDQLVASHLPVALRSSDAGLVIVGHIARANGHRKQMDGSVPALAVFHGPHAYVSPTWYETAPAVPTWNYAVVHARGLPVLNEDPLFLRGVLEELVARHEAHRPGGWRPDGVPAGYYEQMARAIVAFEMPVATVEGKFKLGQNRSAEDRRGAIAGLEKEGTPGAAELADFMRRHAGV